VNSAGAGSARFVAYEGGHNGVVNHDPCILEGVEQADGRDRGNRNWLSALALATLYFALAALTLRYTRFNGGVALIWIATAPLLAYLVTRPTRLWLIPALACGVAGVIATIMFGLGPKAALPFALINLGEAIGGALILRRLLPRSYRFESLREIGIFLGVAGILMPALAGFFAGLTANAVTGLPMLRNWFDYFTGHGLGAIAFTPLVLLASSGEVRNWTASANARERVEATFLVLVMGLVTLGSFSQDVLPLLFLPILPMMIAVFRIGRLGAALTITLLTVIALICTIDGYGPINLIAGSSGMHAQFLQFYLACAVLIAWPAAAELKHRKIVHGQLQAASAVARLVVDRTGDVIIYFAVDGTMQYISPAIEIIAGYGPDELTGKMPHSLIHPADMDEAIRVHRLALQRPDDIFIVEYRARSADGSYSWYEGHSRAAVDGMGQATGVVSIIHGVSARKDAESALVREAQTDPLTGVFNRRGFDAALAERFADGAPATPFTVVMFDLDHFKAINDTYGHETGDLVIKAFAEHLQGTLRRNDVIARFGGEEFVAILDGTSAQAAHEVCERLRVGFAQFERRSIDGRGFRVTVSGGIAVYREGIDMALLLAEADAALYRAKSEGRNRLALAA